ncbi:ABC transporter substrate-binding protein [Edaphovirga cremea]|uniref:ABC transporter substrate-binding protein n=1 Tax=Edaphovirga cremea TaxID=2267246 RepID=UPI000DEF9E68|nr:ABC transporter substrate-binding protein [Edaphovirga cremea]
MTSKLNILNRTILFASLMMPLVSYAETTPAPAEIRISWWGGNMRHEATLAAIDAFQKLHPEIKVKAEYSGYDGYLSRLSTQIAGQQEPDVMRIDWNWLPQLSKTGEGFYDLKPLSKKLGLENYGEKYLNMATVAGKLQGIPISMTSRVFLYNQNTWQKVGISYPTNWDQLFEAGKVFQQKLGDKYYLLGVALGAADALDILSLGRAYMTQKYGTDIIDIKENKLGWDEKQILELFTFYKKLVDSHVIPDQRYFSSHGRANIYEIKPWINGELAGMYLWDSSIYTYANNVVAGTVMEPGPFIQMANEKDSGITTKPSSLFSISKETKFPEQSAMLLEFMLNQEAGIKALGLQNGMPTNQKADKILTDAGIITQDNLLAKSWRAAMAQPVSKAPVSAFMENQELVQLWTNSLQKIDYGKDSVENVAADFERSANRILRRAMK